RRCPVATTKGARATQYPIAETDAVHLYSVDTHTWLQLRRDVRTEQDNGRSSLKVAVYRTPDTAHKLGVALITIADRNKEKLKTKSAESSKPKAKSATTYIGIIIGSRTPCSAVVSNASSIPSR